MRTFCQYEEGEERDSEVKRRKRRRERETNEKIDKGEASRKTRIERNGAREMKKKGKKKDKVKKKKADVVCAFFVSRWKPCGPNCPYWLFFLANRNDALCVALCECTIEQEARDKEGCLVGRDMANIYLLAEEKVVGRVS